MKKIIILILVFASGFCFAENLLFMGSIKINEYNKFLKRMLLKDLCVYYVLEEKRYFFTKNQSIGITRIYLDKEEIEKFRKIATKYFEWNKKAIKKQVTLEKEIGKLIAPIAWEYGSSWFFSDDDCKIKCSFFFSK